MADSVSNRSSKIGIIIPAYNAAETLGEVLADCRRHTSEILVIDDGSIDETLQIAKASGARTLQHGRNLGKGMALKTGFAAAATFGWDAVITLDADGQHDTEDLPKFFEKHDENPQALLLGRRDPMKMPKKSRFSRKLGDLFLSPALGQRIPDSQCGFRLYPSSWLNTLQLHGTRYELETEILIVAGKQKLPILSIPIETLYFVQNRSHLRPWRDTWRSIFVYFNSFKKDWLKERIRSVRHNLVSLALIVGLSLFIASCRGNKPVSNWPAYPETPDPALLAHSFDATAPEWTTVFVKFHLEVEGLEKSPTALNGELILSKPNSIRIRAYTPMGLAAFDLLYLEKHVELFVPDRKELVIIPINQLNAVEFGKMPLQFPKPEDWMHLLTPWQKPRPAEQEMALIPGEDGQHPVFVVGKTRYRFDPKDGRIFEVERPDNRTLIYNDWKVFGDHEYPTRITIADKNSDGKPMKVRLQIRVKSITENPEVPADAFAPLDRKNLKVTNLTKK